jgi:hypothetical protein
VKRCDGARDARRDLGFLNRLAALRTARNRSEAWPIEGLMTDRKRMIESSERVPTRSEILKPHRGSFDPYDSMDIDDLPVAPPRAETRPSSDGVPLTLTGEQRKRLQAMLERKAAALRDDHALREAAAIVGPHRSRRSTAELRERVLRRRARLRTTP